MKHGDGICYVIHSLYLGGIINHKSIKMKKILLSLFVLSLIGCQPPKEQKTSPNMEFGGWSGISDDHSKESLMAREFNEYYVTNTFQKGASMISDDAEEFFFQ